VVKRIDRYLLGTKDKGIIFEPDPTRSLEVFADLDFCGLNNPETAIYDLVTSKSQTGFIIQFMGCPIVGASTLQTEIALLTCEAEYTSCLESLCLAIPLMHLIKEFKSCCITTTTSKAKILCKLFCDNQGACELIRLPKIRPSTKHMNTRLHHFRDHVTNGSITIQDVPTQEQLADIATKPLSAPLFSKFCASILGW
jgi:histone deacetylase 1/2